MQPEVRYAKSGDVHIAYQVFGEGEMNLVMVPGFVSNIEVLWEQPEARQCDRGEESPDNIRASGPQSPR
jgi:hypothetical protein